MKKVATMNEPTRITTMAMVPTSSSLLSERPAPRSARIGDSERANRRDARFFPKGRAEKEAQQQLRVATSKSKF